MSARNWYERKGKGTYSFFESRARDRDVLKERLHGHHRRFVGFSSVLKTLQRHRVESAIILGRN